MAIDWSQTLGWEPTSSQNQKFEQFYQILIEVNRSLNLTRITDRTEFWEKHFWDSLSGIAPWLGSVGSENWMRDLTANMPVQNVIDIGSGGGFPGIPVAIACPDWQVTLLDSTQKKIKSLSQILVALDCPSVTAICDRAEQFGHLEAYRERYDLALIRAVASAPACAEYAMPLIQEQGIVVLYRGQWELSEEMALCKTIATLGGEVCHVQSYKTPLSQSDRHCIYLRKTKPTPEKYPRRVGVPVKKPLG